MKRLRKTAYLVPPMTNSPEVKVLHGRNWNHAALVILGVLLVMGLLYWFWQAQWIITTGRVVFQQTRLASPLKGRIQDILVREGDVVAQGQVLAHLDGSQLRAEYEGALARVAQARARLRLRRQTGLDPSVQRQLASADRDVALARHRLAQAKAEMQAARIVVQQSQQAAKKADALLLLRAITHAQRQQRRAAFQTTKAQYAKAVAKIKEAQANFLGAQRLRAQAREQLIYAKRTMANDVALLQLEVENRESEAKAAQSRLSQLSIRAPHDGIVSWVPRKDGEVIDHDDTLLGLMNPESVWVETYVDGDVLHDLRQHQEAWIKIDGLSDDYFPASVSIVYPTDRLPEEPFRVGPYRARTSDHLSDLTHPVKITFVDAPPTGLRPEMISWVWITR